jgi:hypothetical protein
MIKQLGPPTFFVTFTYIKRLWDPFIKALHTLHASKLNFPNKIKDLQSLHIVKLIWSDPIICVRYYNHKTSSFHKFVTNDHYLFGHIFIFYFVTKFQNHKNKHDHGLLWIKYVHMYRVCTNEEIEWFIDMYISCDVSLLPPLQNAHQHTCTCKRKIVVYRFYYPLPSMRETKILEPLQIDGNYPFSQQCFHTQAKNIFQF